MFEQKMWTLPLRIYTNGIEAYGKISVSLVIREMQNKIAMRYHYTY